MKRLPENTEFSEMRHDDIFEHYNDITDRGRRAAVLFYLSHRMVQYDRIIPHG